MKLIPLLLVYIVLFTNCESKNQESSSTTGFQAVEDSTKKGSEIIRDTISAKAPVRIGNDFGKVHIKGVRVYRGNKLARSDFEISLEEIDAHPLVRPLNISSIVDSIQTVLFKDTTTQDYTQRAIIRSIDFEFVRANTLYFIAELENPTEHKEIFGRFSLFYRTQKKGQLYGWITDRVKDY